MTNDYYEEYESRSFMLPEEMKHTKYPAIDVDANIEELKHRLKFDKGSHDFEQLRRDLTQEQARLQVEGRLI